jgi:hypothetical protein
MEIVKVTARTGDVFTIERAQESTTAHEFIANDKVELLITAGIMEDLRDKSVRIDNVPTDLLTGLNADKLDGAHSSEFYLNTADLRIADPRVIDFGTAYREDIKLYTSYTEIDPYWANVVLLMPMNGDMSSSVFRDVSSNPKTITPHGNAQHSINQYKFGSSSAYFDESGDYLTFPSLTFDGDFTIEMWVYVTGTSNAAYVPLYDTRTGALFQNVAFGFNYISSVYRPDVVFSNGRLTGTTTSLSFNSWTHVAITRLGSTVSAFINGVKDATTYTYSGTVSPAGATCYIGAVVDPIYTQGYIDDLRITNGVARYTASFTPPDVPHTTIGWTDQLYDPYYLNTVLLLHCNGTAGSTVFTDSSFVPKTVTAYGNAALSSTQYKFGGVSAYFDGSEDYLETTDPILAENYTIECWLYPTERAPDANWGRYAYSQYDNRTDFGNRFGFGLPETGSYTNKLTWFHASGGGTLFSTNDIPLNAWTHVALTYDGSTRRMFLNGVLEASVATSGASLSNVTPRIGALYYSGILGFYKGYIDEFRVTKGVARYTAAFIPPTLPFADTRNLTIDNDLSKVGLLMHFNGTPGSTNFVDSSLTPKIVTSYGNAQHSINQYKFGGSSSYFNGSSGYLSVNASSDFTFGTGDFTVECWAYMSAYGSRITNRTYGAYSGTWSLGLNQYPSFTEVVYGEPGVVSTTAVSLNTWTHIAACRSSGTLRIYINGVLGGSAANSTNFSTSDFNLLIGRSSPSETIYFSGYLDELRITKGLARYTTAFTPPTKPFVDRNQIASIGSQADTIYQRSSKNFAWYKDGIHSDAALDPGFGGTAQMVLNEYGHLLIGTTADDSSGSLIQVNGNLAFIGSSRRIVGDFNNVTHANRTLFQSTSAGQTNVGVVPNSTNNAAITCFDNSTPENCSFAQMVMVNASDCRFISGAIGSGTYRPMTFYTNNAEVMRIGTDFKVGIGTTSAQSNLHVANVSTDSVRGFISEQTNNDIHGAQIRMLKSRGTQTTRTAVQSGDTIGNLSYTGYVDSTVASECAAIKAQAEGNFTASSSPTFLQFFTCPSGSLTAPERMRITGAGRLLIGTSIDDTINKLQVSGSIVQSPLASVTPANNGELVFEATSNTTITVKYKGSDGTVRSGTITLT